MAKEKKYYLFKLNMSICNLLAIIIGFVMLAITYFIGLDYMEVDCLFVLFLIILIVYLMFHEVLHSIGYLINGAKFNNITYGIELEKGIFYCLCKQNISKRNILISSLLPFVILGLVAYILGVVYNIKLLIILSIFNISGCAGDLITFFFLLKLKNIEFTELDDTTSFAIYSSKDLSKVKHFGLKYLECKEKVERKNLKKFTISRTSIFIFLIMFLATAYELIWRIYG